MGARPIASFVVSWRPMAARRNLPVVLLVVAAAGAAVLTTLLSLGVLRGRPDHCGGREGWKPAPGEASRGATGAGPAISAAPLETRRDGSRPSPPVPGSDEAGAGSGADRLGRRPPSEAMQRLVAELGLALGGPDDRQALLAAARALRDALLADPRLIGEAAYVLLDDTAPPKVREALAVVLATLPGPDGKRAIVDGLGSGAFAGFERVAMLALGIEAGGDADEALEYDGHPYALELVPGLIAVVRGPIEDATARARLLDRLAGSVDAADRLAAARAIRDSTAFPEIREALLEKVASASEPDPEVVASAGGALGAWARDVGPGDPERGRVVASLLDAVTSSEEALHVSLAPALGGAKLTSEEGERLRALAASTDARVRHFAVEALEGQLEVGLEPDDTRVAVLAEAALADPSTEVRRAAAHALVRAPGDPRAVEACVAALRHDGDPGVRAAAARALGRSLGSEAARAALEAAAARDGDAHVRETASRMLGQLRR